MPPGVRSINHSEAEAECKLREDAQKAIDAAMAVVKEKPHH